MTDEMASDIRRLAYRRIVNKITTPRCADYLMEVSTASVGADEDDVDSNQYGIYIALGDDENPDIEIGTCLDKETEQFHVWMISGDENDDTAKYLFHVIPQCWNYARKDVERESLKYSCLEADHEQE